MASTTYPPIRLPHPYLTSYTVIPSGTALTLSLSTDQPQNGRALLEPLHDPFLSWSPLASPSPASTPPASNNTPWARARRAPATTFSWPGAAPSLAAVWGVVHAIYLAHPQLEYFRLSLAGTTDAALVRQGLVATGLGINHPRGSKDGGEGEGEVLVLRSAFWQGAASPVGPRPIWVVGEGTDGPLEKGLDGYPLMPEGWTVTDKFPAEKVYTRHPIRKAKPAPGSVAYSRWVPEIGMHFSLEAVNWEDEAHLELFNQWQNDPRVAAGWNETGTVDEHREYLKRLHEDSHVVCFFGRFDDTRFAYFELYWSKEDHYGAHYDAGDYDRGRHSLVGDASFRGAQKVNAWYSSCIHYCFLDEPRTANVVGEPKATGSIILSYENAQGLTIGKYVDLGHKRSVHSVCSREKWFQLCPLFWDGRERPNESADRAAWNAKLPNCTASESTHAAMKLVNSLTGYASLLLAANPSRADLCLLATAVVAGIASGVPFPLIGVFFGQLLNDFNAVSCLEAESEGEEDAGEYQDGVNGKILMIFYLAIAQFVLIYGHLLCWSLFGTRLAQRLRESYLQKLLQQEPSHFDELPPGEVASRLSSDISTIRSGTSEKVGICLSSVSFFVTAYVVAFVMDSKLAAILISLIPAYFIMSFVGSYYIEHYSGLMADYAASAASIASEALNNVVVVQAFGANARLEDKFSGALRSSKREGLKKATAIGIQSGVLYFISYSANGLAFWQGSKNIAVSASHPEHTGGTTVGATFTVIFILIEGFQVAPFVHLFSAAVASYRKLREEIDRSSLIDGTATSGLPITPGEGGFELRDVSFAYPSRPEVAVLEHVSISIPRNKHTAIVGLSGSGKSTVAGLVTRLYDPTQGSVSFGGHDVKDLNVRGLRSFLSLVQQEPSLLDRSLLENIAHGLINSNNPSHVHLQPVLLGPDLADLAAEVREGQDLMAAAEKRGPIMSEIVSLALRAATLADAHEFISKLQFGYGTVAGSSGRLISGGQKQRVSLARALVKDPAVLILDEATASLDSRSEERIRRAVANISDGRTVLTIAHRLSTITDADNIIVMHKGHVVEGGTHAELMAKSGAYADLVRLQTLTAAPRKDDADTASLQDAATRSSSNTNDAASDPEKSRLSIAEAPVSTDEGGDEPEPPTPSRSFWGLLKGYAPALRPHALTACLALLGAAIVGGAFSGEAVIFGNTFFGLMFFVLAIIELFANVASWTGFGWVTEKIVYSVRVLSFRSLFEQDIQWHQSADRSPAMLLSYITRDGNALAGLSGSVVGTLFSISVNLIAAIVLTHIIAWRVALVCLALVPLLLGAGILELRILGRFEERHETAYTKSVDIGTEAIASIKTIAALSLEAETLAAYRRSLRGPTKENLAVTVQASLCQAMTYFFGNCVNALAYWWGAKQIIAGNTTTTEFLIVVFSLLVSALLWSQMFALAPELSSARAAMARILGLIEIGSAGMRGHVEGLPLTAGAEEAGLEKSVAGETRAASVGFQDVRFSYPARPDAEVLKGLTLDIKPGTFVALVGPSGAGKSTIISLVERLYTPQSGAVLIDGVDVTKSRDVAFRDAIALVPQESMLFEGSIEFNIGLGARPGHDVSSGDIVAACKLANIHDVIAALPEGYQTLCGTNGARFSGGQKQRLSIARALVRKPKLLILDEPTSALDAESEQLLQDGLDKAARGITVIAIAHRLHTIRKADRIYWIEDGQCVDSGTHAELVEKSPHYRANVMHQTVAQ
ncbi:mating factor A secretion protein STE6-like protein [Lasiosphaeris hirsuta]|uniref:Mating factor A secretion protein STE6-like protein n=1 Tax=Lasiosphaeris hirsuta TaxID=260670 RepID=A0AA40EBI2_9PEZI|nr:mating factor A secretion protein STE6-like protein [Lasiosphaeris hirsuta]